MMGDSTEKPLSRKLLIENLLQGSGIGTCNEAKLVFESFDGNKDGLIDKREFEVFLDAVFTGITIRHADIKQKMFERFVVNSGGFLDYESFSEMWCSRWMHAVLNPAAALVIVDVQNDFIDGSLALKNCPAGQDGADVIPVINCMLDKHATSFKLVVYTQDYHPPNHCSFAENVGLQKISSSSKINADNAKPFDVVIYAGPPERDQKLWPVHCVRETWGSAVHTKLKVPDGAVFIRKAEKADIDAYSGFGNLACNYQTELLEVLESRGITDVYVCGLASDICVHETLMDAIKLGFRTVFVEDAARGVSLEGIDATRNAFLKENGFIIDSGDIGDILTGQNRPIELAWQILEHAPEKSLKRANLFEPESSANNLVSQTALDAANASD